MAQVDGLGVPAEDEADGDAGGGLDAALGEEVELAVGGAVEALEAAGADVVGKGLHAGVEPVARGAVRGEDLGAGGAERGGGVAAEEGAREDVRVGEGAEVGEPAGEGGRGEEGVEGGVRGPAHGPGPVVRALHLLAQVDGPRAGDGLHLRRHVVEGRRRAVRPVGLQRGAERERRDLDEFLVFHLLLDDVVHSRKRGKGGPAEAAAVRRGGRFRF